jgi:hypothetical protein
MNLRDRTRRCLYFLSEHHHPGNSLLRLVIVIKVQDGQKLALEFLSMSVLLRPTGFEPAFYSYKLYDNQELTYHLLLMCLVGQGNSVHLFLVSGKRTNR